MRKDSDRAGMIIEGKGTECMRQDMGGTQEDLRLSPKIINKMKVVKARESQNDQPRNMMGRTVLTTAKT